MFESKYSNFLTVLLVIIIVAVVILLGYLGYTYYKNYNIDKDANDFVSSFVEEDDGTNTNVNNNSSGNIADNINAVDTANAGGKKQFNGFDVIGTIEIPKTNLSYPVLAKVTIKSLETSVAALYPENAVLNTVGNVVIIGHNYRNGLFFSNNKKLSNGDKIYLTGLDNNKVTYVIYNMFEASENDTSFYNRDTNGAREITLSTCNDNSSARLIIEAREE